MSYSTMILNHHQGSLFLKPNIIDRSLLQRRKAVVCCCPWSESGMEKKKIIVLQHKTNNTSPLPSKNFISYLLSLGPLSLIINKTGKRKNLPPTPSFLHLIGLYRYLRQSRPNHYALRDLANKWGPIVYLEAGERSAAIISSARIAKELMRTHDPAYADRPKVLGNQMLSYNERGFGFHKYDEYWKQMRSLCISELLSAKKVWSLGHIRKEEGSALVESIQTGVPFNLSDKISLYICTVICRAVFGTVPVAKAEALVSLIRKSFQLVGRVSVSDLFPSIKTLNFLSLHKLKAQKLARQLDTIVEGLIDIEHRSKEGDEYYIDVMLRFKESGTLEYPVTDDNIKSLALDMILPGTETASSVADWAMAELMKNPRVMEKAQDEIRQAFEGKETIQECEIGRLKYLKLVIMETLRLHPPTPLDARSCREEVEVDGYHIPLNTSIIINSWAIGRDPTHWKNPESFEPERFEENPYNFFGTHFEFIPFGLGKRMCPGMTFALAEIEFILAQLLYHFDWELPSGNKLDMTDVGGIAFSRKSPLYLIAKPYY